MTRAHAKAQTPAASDAPEDGTQQDRQQATASAGPTDAAVVRAPAPAPQRDEHTGKGGLYTVIRGNRALVHATNVSHPKD